MTTHGYRAELDVAGMPAALRAAPVHRGYPVPWFVDWLNGAPEFRAMDGRRFDAAVRQGRCWTCGEPIAGRFGFGVTRAFLIGPMCAINRISSEPPSHHACATWAARNCPFLSRPTMRRREDDLINEGTLATHSAGISVARNPGVALVWPTSGYDLIPDHQGRPLFGLRPPTGRLEWWCEGRPATRAEVMASIESGLPGAQ